MNNETIEAEIVEELINVPELADAKLPYEISYIDELVQKFSKIPELVAEDGETDEYKDVKSGGILLSKVINAIEKQRKFLTDPAFKYQKETKAKFDAEKKKLEPIRDLLKIQRAKVDGYLENKRIEAELAEEARIDNIKALISRYKSYPIECIGKNSNVIQEVLSSAEAPKQEILEEFFDEAVLIYDASMTQIRQMLENQISVENAEKIQAEAEAKADAEEAEKQAIRDAEQKKLDDERAEFEKEKRDFEAQQKAIHDEAERIEAIKRSDELQAKQEEEQKQKAIQDEAERKQKEAEQKEAYNEQYNESWDDLQEAFENKREALLDLIIEGKIRHVKWGV